MKLQELSYVVLADAILVRAQLQYIHHVHLRLENASSSLGFALVLLGHLCALRWTLSPNKRNAVLWPEQGSFVHVVRFCHQECCRAFLDAWRIELTSPAVHETPRKST